MKTVCLSNWKTPELLIFKETSWLDLIWADQIFGRWKSMQRNKILTNQVAQINKDERFQSFRNFLDTIPLGTW